MALLFLWNFLLMKFSFVSGVFVVVVVSWPTGILVYSIANCCCWACKALCSRFSYVVHICIFYIIQCKEKTVLLLFSYKALAGTL